MMFCLIVSILRSLIPYLHTYIWVDKIQHKFAWDKPKCEGLDSNLKLNNPLTKKLDHAPHGMVHLCNYIEKLLKLITLTNMSQAILVSSC